MVAVTLIPKKDIQPSGECVIYFEGELRAQFGTANSCEVCGDNFEYLCVWPNFVRRACGGGTRTVRTSYLKR